MPAIVLVGLLFTASIRSPGLTPALAAAPPGLTDTTSTAVLAAYGPPWTGAISAFFCFVALLLGLAAQRRTESARPSSNEAA